MESVCQDNTIWPLQVQVAAIQGSRVIVLTKVADIPIFYSSSFLSANKLN